MLASTSFAYQKSVVHAPNAERSIRFESPSTLELPPACSPRHHELLGVCPILNLFVYAPIRIKIGKFLALSLSTSHLVFSPHQ